MEPSKMGCARLLCTLFVTLAATTSLAVTTQGLVAHYPLDGNTSDASGHGFHGESYGLMPETDRFGSDAGCMSFDGVNDWINIPYQEGMHCPYLTVSAWVKIRQSTGTYQVLVSRWASSGSNWVVELSLDARRAPFSTRVAGFDPLESTDPAIALEY